MSFSQIRGQNQPIQLLKGYIQQNRLEAGYLFLGPEGVGKKLIAKTLAKAVNCLQGKSDSCDRCSSCIKIENNQHPDVNIIETEGSEIKIEYIRQMQKTMALKPYEGKLRVFIIDNAHNLNAQSATAMLKVLEEPPVDSLIILITDKVSLLFRTIISRCKILKFSALSRIKLKEILKQEYAESDILAHFLAYFSEGRFGYALRLKDKDILREKNRIIDNFVLSSRVRLRDLSLENREQVRDYLDILAAYFRDIYLLKIGIAYSEVINLDRKNELLRQMHRFSFLDLNRILNLICESILYLEQNINVKLMLYNLVVQLCPA